MLGVALTAAALLSCGRTQLGALEDSGYGAGSFAGAFAPGVAGAGVAVGAVGHAGVAGIDGASGSTGIPVGSLGGAAAMGHAGSAESGGVGGLATDESAGSGGAGGAGAGGSAPALAACKRDVTPILHGPFVSHMRGEPATSVAGDWDRDGKLDLATANTDGSVSVLLGNGDGSFASSITYSSGSDLASPWFYQGSIAAGDLDANGSLDLVLDQPQGVNVLLGLGDGTFASPRVYPLPSAQAGLALGDFDFDGDTDVAVGSNDVAVVVLFGNGDGTLSLGTSTPVGDPLKYIAAGDLNHDGRLDIVALGQRETNVLLGDGQGGFVKFAALETDTYDGGVELADFNADGDLDFVRSLGCGPPDGGASVVELWLGKGDGTFQSKVSTVVAGCVGRPVVADVNGDGTADVLPNSVTALLGQRSGPFAPILTSSRAGGSDALLGLGDWNGDGKLDLATASDDWVAVQLGNGDGTFGSNPVYATTAPPQGAPAVADFDADGQLDVASAAAWYGLHGGASDTSLDVFRGAGDGTLLERVAFETQRPARDPVAVDLDADGWLDIVTLSAPSWIDSSISVQLGTGNGTFAPEALWLTGRDVQAFTVGDLNGDQHPDVVAIAQWKQQLFLLYGTGDGAFAPIRSVDLPDTPSAATVVDVNGDAKQDLVVTLSQTGTIDVLLGRGDGAFDAGELFPIGTRPVGIAPADLNADGNLDLVTWGSDSFSVLLGAGDGSFTNRRDYPELVNQLLAVELDQDARQDLILVNASGFTLLLGAGDGTFTCVTRYLGPYMSGLAVGDLNHDGRMDLVTTTREGVNVFLNRTP